MSQNLSQVQLFDEVEMAGSPMEALLEAAGDLTLHFDESGKASFTSRSARKWWGEPELSVGRTFVDMFLPESAQELASAFSTVLNHGKVCEFTAPLQDYPNRPLRWKLCRYTVGKLRGVLAVARDVTAVRELEYKLAQSHKHDIVTSLPNRSAAPELYQHMSSLLAHSEKALCLAVIYVSGLSRINSALGSAAGDAVLAQLATRINTSALPPFSLMRVGSKEFALLMSSAPDKEELIRAARQLVALLEGPYFVNRDTVHLKVRIGLTMTRSMYSTVDELFSAANLALKRAKEFSQISFLDVSESGIAEAKTFMRLESDLHEAMRQGELYLAYQPLVYEKGIYGVEALMRWRRQDGKEVSPAVFIPVAEANGLIQILGEWALKRATYEIAAFNKKYGIGLQVSVNVIPVQFLNKGFARSVESIMAASELPPELLQLEITEGTLMAEPELVEKLLQGFSRKGIQIAVDDFGTGYSSLAYLKRFHLTTLKIDRSFVKDLPDSESDLAVCAAISDMATKLKMRVVAEGIETDEQYQLLRTVMKNGGYQGYLFGKPTSLKELADRYFPQKIETSV